MEWQPISDAEHALRLQQLLNEMEDTGCVMSCVKGKNPFYALSIARGCKLVMPPGRENTAAHNAYVNLQYHAANPGALFMNDENTRAGVEMALQALRKMTGGKP